MFAKMIRGSLSRSWRGKLLVAVSVALGACVTTAICTVMVSVADEVNQELKTYGSNIMVRPRQAALLADIYNSDSGATLDERELGKVKTIFWAYNIVDFSPFLRAEATLDGEPVATVGVWFDKFLSLPTGEELTTGVRPLRSWWDVRGEWGDDSGERAMVGAEFAAEHGLDVGSPLELRGDGLTARFTVAGVFDSGGEFDDAALVPLSQAQLLSGRANGVNWVEVSALTTPDNELARKGAADTDALSAADWETWYCTAYVSSIAYQIEEVLPDAVAKPVRQVSESEGVILERVELLMLLVTGLCLVGAALAVTNLLTNSVLERSEELALLKAIGASDRAVMALVLTETMLIALAGAVVGEAAGFALAQLIGWQVFGSAVAANQVVFAFVLVLAVVSLGSWPAMRLLRRLRPAEVLHGN
jgi:putative ABC transport system permease protein